MLTYLDLGDARYRKLEEYSTGMKQRLKLAQALVHDPPALCSTNRPAAWIPPGREAMLDLLVRLGKDHKKAILLSTHLLGDIDKVCDAVVILHQGRILVPRPRPAALSKSARPLPLAHSGRTERLSRRIAP